MFLNVHVWYVRLFYRNICDILVEHCQAVGFNIPGGDIKSYNNILTVKDCVDKCQEWDNCVAWLYNYKQSKCWSKDEKHKDPKSWEGGIMGPKTCLSTYNDKSTVYKDM